MIDFHSHILPRMDDGSKSVEESLQMLRLSQQQGVTKMVATPHFYAQKESPERFLMRRERAWTRLSSVLEENMPEIYLGAEVYYYTGISNTDYDCLSQLCIGNSDVGNNGIGNNSIENSNVLLLEMPFHRWTDRMIEETISLAQDTEFTVLLAHIDRYLVSQKADTWERLADNGILFQLNASSFLDGWSMRHQACRLLKSNRIATLGTDCHNMENRKPNLGEAVDVIQKKCGEEVLQRLTEEAESLLNRKNYRITW